MSASPQPATPAAPTATHPPPRRLYMVLSPRALSYASLALRSLFEHSDEAFDLRLITDSAADKQRLADAIAALQPEGRCSFDHAWSVTTEDDLADAEAHVFARYPNLRTFRHGHPCWRKITDPVLLDAPGEELILLDPDLYFPNRFRFEPTPDSGLLLMWQRPNCLLPAGVVRTAIEANIPLARHVDIGVAHWRLSSGLGELEWLDWLIGRLGGQSLPRAMHVEAVVWSAIAMRQGGGYLDPRFWVCWQRTQAKRVQRRLGASGNRLLASEPWPRMKCFHAGGEAKGWLAETLSAGKIGAGPPHIEPSSITPFVELTPTRYEREQTAKSILGGLGYYRVFGAGRS